MRKALLYAIGACWLLLLVPILTLLLLHRPVRILLPIADAFPIALPVVSLVTIIYGLNTLYRKGVARGKPGNSGTEIRGHV